MLRQPRELLELVQAARFMVDIGQGYDRDTVAYRIAMRRLEMAVDAIDGSPQVPSPGRQTRPRPSALGCTLLALLMAWILGIAVTTLAGWRA